MKRILDKTNLIISRRQPQNLKQHLTKAHFTQEKPITNISRYHESRFGTCDVMITGNSLTLKNGKHWQIKTAMDCKSKNVICVIICPKCERFYVDQTKNLRKRVTPHKEQIKLEEYRHLDISEHIAKCGNGHFNIMPIQERENSTRLFGETKELEIINIHQPDLNTNLIFKQHWFVTYL